MEEEKGLLVSEGEWSWVVLPGEVSEAMSGGDFSGEQELFSPLRHFIYYFLCFGSSAVPAAVASPATSSATAGRTARTAATKTATALLTAASSALRDPSSAGGRAGGQSAWQWPKFATEEKWAYYFLWKTYVVH